MAGRRPTHLFRRGATYLVRFRLPVDLARQLGVADLRRSLYTSDLVVARRRQSSARVWFEQLVEQLRAMSLPTRADLDRAAVAYFGRLAAEGDVEGRYPREWENYREERNQDVALAEEGLSLLHDELVSNNFAKGLSYGDEVLRIAGATAEVPPDLLLAARQVGVRAAREATRLFIHRVTAPHLAFTPEDPLFTIHAAASHAPLPQPTAVSGGITLAAAGERYLERKRQQKLGKSNIDELARVLRWLREVIGPDQMLTAVTPETMRQFRDDLQRLRSKKGTEQTFKAKLADDGGEPIGYATSSRYWQSVRGFFAWALEEQWVTANPAEIAKPPKPKDVTVASPDPFAPEELKAIFTQPLYAGYRSLQRPNTPGTLHLRGGRWWSGVLLLHTGMRAGELAQLLPSDFVFDHEVPYLKIQREDGEGKQVKSVKTNSSVRDVPLHPDLLTLGLAEFVGGRAAKHPKSRVFSEFRLGKGRSSAGLTRYWGDLLERAGVHSPGRATHVWRHSLIAFLRAADVAVEDIAAVVGHVAADGPIQTAKYGGAYPLARKAKSLSHLAFGFDFVELVGGPYQAKKHRAP